MEGTVDRREETGIQEEEAKCAVCAVCTLECAFSVQFAVSSELSTLCI